MAPSFVVSVLQSVGVHYHWRVGCVFGLGAVADCDYSVHAVVDGVLFLPRTVRALVCLRGTVHSGFRAAVRG